ncbi:ankyrin repeat domain-containing protein [Streptomyces sp. NPDC007896]|uniref:ankyrin repeat domain-containing protein n=1 Tax=unclassified Streptomyces TaxID=2593676 RepID=UPI0036E1406B
MAPPRARSPTSALVNQHTETVRELLAHGADPNLREDHGAGWSPLDWALNGPHPETADLLTVAGATPLHKAGQSLAGSAIRQAGLRRRP